MWYALLRFRRPCDEVLLTLGISLLKLAPTGAGYLYSLECLEKIELVLSRSLLEERSLVPQGVVGKGGGG